jgi:hypothetical protein
LTRKRSLVQTQYRPPASSRSGAGFQKWNRPRAVYAPDARQALRGSGRGRRGCHCRCLLSGGGGRVSTSPTTSGECRLRAPGTTSQDVARALVLPRPARGGPRLLPPIPSFPTHRGWDGLRSESGTAKRSCRWRSAVRWDDPATPSAIRWASLKPHRSVSRGQVAGTGRAYARTPRNGVWGTWGRPTTRMGDGAHDGTGLPSRLGEDPPGTPGRWARRVGIADDVASDTGGCHRGWGDVASGLNSPRRARGDFPPAPGSRIRDCRPRGSHSAGQSP